MNGSDPISTSISAFLSGNLNDCGCCEGLQIEAPITVYNRPGLEAIQRRIGTHPSFKRSLLTRLSRPREPEFRAILSQLNTRAEHDFAIALLDAWAVVDDVLTFYQERINNECYLRTATERLSLLHLARLIGYELRPGVAASAYLAFILEQPTGLAASPTPGLSSAIALGVVTQTTIQRGTQVQSIPQPGEQPQIFETTTAIQARVEWNAIRPQLLQPQARTATTLVLLLEGIATGLKPGDGLLLPLDGGNHAFRQVAEVMPQPELQRTEIRLAATPTAVLSGIVLPSQLPPPPNLSPQFAGLPALIRDADLQALAQTRNFALADLFANLAKTRPNPPTVFALRTQAAIFGHTAPPWRTLPYTLREGEAILRRATPTPVITAGPTANSTAENALPRSSPLRSNLSLATTPTVFQDVITAPYANRQNSWADTATLGTYPGEANNSQAIYLDNVYGGIAKNSWIVLKDGATLRAYQVESTTELAKTDFTLTARISRLSLTARTGLETFKIRSTTVFGQPQELVLAAVPIPTSISGAQLELEGWIEGLSVGQGLILCGEVETKRGVQVCEYGTLAEVEHLLSRTGFTRITLNAPLTNVLVRSTVTINANVVLATHGETRSEILGSGDSSQANQRFGLRQPPLTFVSAPTPSGAASTLEIRVNGIRWQEVPSFYNQGATAQVYITRTDDDGKMTVQFGDGRNGARLPTGQDNVRAVYQRGAGLEGQVRAGQLSLLLSRPPGVREVINPLAAEGAADRESRDEARRNAPLTVLTLDRIVSLKDYENFARAYAGIAKALATWTWIGQTRAVFITVAGPNGAEFSSNSPLLENLLAAMRQAGDPLVPIQLQSYRRAFFKLAAAVKVDPHFLSSQVLSQVEAALRFTFSFEQRAFGQPVTLSEVIAVMQAVPGVVAVNLTALYRSLQPPINRRSATLPDFLLAELPQAGATGAVAAELLTLDPNPLTELGVLP